MDANCDQMVLTREEYNKKIYDQMVLAHDDYGEEVYNQTITYLQQKYGKETFPSWIKKFNGWVKPLSYIPENESMQLWRVTESFCYKNQDMGYDEFLSPIEREYFSIFQQAFEYNFEI